MIQKRFTVIAGNAREFWTPNCLIMYENFSQQTPGQMLGRARLSIWVNEGCRGWPVLCQGGRAVLASTPDVLQPCCPWQLPAHREGLALSHLLALAAAEGKLLFLGLGYFSSPLF